MEAARSRDRKENTVSGGGGALADGQMDNEAGQEREYDGSRQTLGASLPPRLELKEPAQTSSLTLPQTRCGSGRVSQDSGWSHNN